ncbi:hypothetical protein [Actinoallomurus oryzae]|uniref:hypothetical protein n=1 Tax=Actinoallomurus oryzae TaxID=502180 RepID=UPI0031E80A7E
MEEVRCRSGRARIIPGILAISASVLLAGCGTQHYSAASASRNDGRLPLDSYMLSDGQVETLARAQQKLERQCALDYGVPAAVADSIHVPGTSGIDSRLFKPLPIAAARSTGYDTLNNAVSRQTAPRVAPPLGTDRANATPGPAGPSPRPRQTRPPADAPAVVLGKSAPVAQQAAVVAAGGGTLPNGRYVPRGGCTKKAVSRLHKGAPDLTVDPRGLALTAQLSAEKDARVSTVVHAWSSCMSARGYRYDSPSTAENDTRWRGDLTRSSIRQQELKTAAADSECRQETQLPDKGSAVEAEYQQRLITARGAELNKAAAVTRMWYRTAVSVLSH